MARFDFIAVYILTNMPRGTLYIGVTSDVPSRLGQHMQKAGSRFTARYDLNRLVWYEQHETMAPALQREKRLKFWLRNWKIKLMEDANPDW